MDGLILSGTELLHCVDKGYHAQEDDEARFPVRLSGLGNCPRSTRMQLDELADREFSARMLRIFEQGHDRGDKLARALKTGLEEFICARDDPEWATREEGEKADILMALGDRYELLTEEEVWCPTYIKGVMADRVIEKALSWDRLNGISDDTEPSIMVSGDGVLCIRGRADVIITDKKHKHFWVLDFKTKASWGFKKLLDEGNSYGYEIQVLSYIRGFISSQEPGWQCEGAFLYYEDHEKRNHKVLPVELDADALHLAITRMSDLLTNWVNGDDPTAAAAVYSESVNWTKKAHVKALGCLPWQCNYCAVGPIKGQCVDTDVFQLKDIRKPGTEIPKWEILDA